MGSDGIATPWERLQEESARAYHAFELYIEFPVTERSLARVTAKLQEERGGRGAGVGHTGASSRVEKWSSAYRWVERAAAWDAELARTRARGAPGGD